MTTKVQTPTDEEIALQAYYLWESEGRPHGRDWEHWLKAKEILQMQQRQPKATSQALSRTTRPAPTRTDFMKPSRRRQTRPAMLA